MADEFRQQNKQVDEENKEKARTITAIAMGEGDHGNTFSKDELVLIGSVYVNILRKDKPLTASVVYRHRNSDDNLGKPYRMYMYALGSAVYAKNASAKQLAAGNASKIAIAKQVFPTMYKALTDKSYTNQVLDNPNITMQGFHGDLNKWSDQTWNRLGWYVYYVKNGIPNNNSVISILGNDDGIHRNATFLIDERAAMKFLTSLDCGIKWFDNHQTPHYNKETDSYSKRDWPPPSTKE